MTNTLRKRLEETEAIKYLRALEKVRIDPHQAEDMVTAQLAEKVMRHSFKVMADDLVEFVQEEIGGVLDRAVQAAYGPHKAEEAGQCDTGDDMEMGCRSNCVVNAIERIKALTNALSSSDHEYPK